MKICVISFDFWQYDQYIVHKLKEKNIDAHHINMGAFTHTNYTERIINTLSKIFLGKNLKYQRRQNFVLESLKSRGYQDQILILNPDTLDISTLIEIKKHTGRLITYLYDSLDRFPVQEKLYLFDKIFSFDSFDIKKYGFEKLTNYIYLPNISEQKQNPKIDLFYITSYDRKRVVFIKLLAKKLINLDLKFQIMVIGKKGWKHQFLNVFTKIPKNLSVIFSIKKIDHTKLPQYYRNSKALLDLTRENQYGLSFRVFEAMALEKKIVTNNPYIKEYDFYNPNNILILNENCNALDKVFFKTPYEKIPEEIYYKYTIDNWVDRVFNL